MASPHKTPAKLRVLRGRGNGKDVAGRTIEEPPPFKRAGITAPAELAAYARSVWEETAPELTRLDLTKAEDRHALAAYCRVVEQQRDAYVEYREKGMTIDNGRGLVVAPWMKVLDSTSRELRAWAREFGLTPSAESNLKTKVTGDGNDQDVWAAGDAATG